MDDKELTDWERRCVIDEKRAAELSETYSELGFDVKVVDFDPNLLPNEECNTCMMESPSSFKVVYTRKK